MDDELMRLAFRIADLSARSIIEAFCLHTGGTWYRTSPVEQRDTADVRNALRYLKLRGDALPYRVERRRGLVRFADV